MKRNEYDEFFEGMKYYPECKRTTGQNVLDVITVLVGMSWIVYVVMRLAGV